MINLTKTVTSESKAVLLRRFSCVALMLASAFFCYSASCALLHRHGVVDWGLSLQQALAVGLASWMVLPLYWWSVGRWLDQGYQAISSVLTSALLALLLATLSEQWLTSTNAFAETYVFLVHRRLPLALCLWGLMWYWRRTAKMPVTDEIKSLVATTSHNTQVMPTRSGSKWLLSHELYASRANTARIVRLDQVRRFCACENYVEIYIGEAEPVLLRVTMKTLREYLPDEFVAIHRSHIVRRDQMCSKAKGKLRLCDGTLLPIGRQFNGNLATFQH